MNGGNDNIHTEAEIVVDGFTNLTIQGEGINTTIIQAAIAENSGSGRIFNVGTVANQTINLTLEDMTIRHGDATTDGGAVRFY